MGILRNLANRIKNFNIKEQGESSQAASNVQFASPSLELLDTKKGAQESASDFHSEEGLIGFSYFHKHHSRAIKNAEAFANRGRIDQALAIYSSLCRRINDPEIKNKIQSNINYLKDIQERRTDARKQERGEKIENELGSAGGGSQIPLPRELPRKSLAPESNFKSQSEESQKKKKSAPLKKEASLPKKTDPPPLDSKEGTDRSKGKSAAAPPQSQKKAWSLPKTEDPSVPSVSPALQKEQTEEKKYPVPSSKSQAKTKAEVNAKNAQDLIDQIRQKLLIVPSSISLRGEKEELEPIDLPEAERPKLSPKTQFPPKLIISPDLYPNLNSRDSRDRERAEQKDWEEFSTSSDELHGHSHQDKTVVIIERQTVSTPNETEVLTNDKKINSSIEKKAEEIPAPTQERANTSSSSRGTPPPSSDAQAQPASPPPSSAAQAQSASPPPQSTQARDGTKSFSDVPQTQAAQTKLVDSGIGEKSIIVSEEVLLLPVDMPKADPASTKRKGKDSDDLASQAGKQPDSLSGGSSGAISDTEQGDSPLTFQKQTKSVFSLTRGETSGGGSQKVEAQSSEKTESARASSISQSKKEKWPSRIKSKKSQKAKQAESFPENPQQEFKASIELKKPEKRESPFFVLSYDFTKIPDTSKFNKRNLEMGYAYQKYRPMLVKAQDFTRRKMLQNALNHYEVIVAQDIPEELKRMINKNISDISSYLKKSLDR